MKMVEVRSEAGLGTAEVHVFDYLTIPTNAIGKCYLALMAEMTDTHFVLHSVLASGTTPNVTWHRVRAIRRPLAALFVTYRWSVRRKWRNVSSSAVIQSETALASAGIYYMHFCHSLYAEEHWKSMSKWSLREWLRLFDHLLHARQERRTLREAQWIVVPTRRLASELIQVGAPENRIRVIPNPAPVHAPSISSLPIDDPYMVFIAAGQFKRKGLLALLSAIAQHKPAWKLLVVGGVASEIHMGRRWARSLDVEHRVQFIGSVENVHPYLAHSLALVVASTYEVMPMIMLEALTEGTIILSTPVGGTDEMIENGETGFIATGYLVEDIVDLFVQYESLDTRRLREMKDNARERSTHFSRKEFGDRWRALLDEVIDS